VIPLYKPGEGGKLRGADIYKFRGRAIEEFNDKIYRQNGYVSD